MYKSFWMGYVQCFYAILQILKNKKVPTISKIWKVLNRYPHKFDSRYTAYYINNGGLIEYALDAIIKTSKADSCPYPTGEFFEVSSRRQKHDSLPEMKRYDFDYELVWEELCISDCMEFELSHGGPYFTDEEFIDDDEETDDLESWD